MNTPKRYGNEEHEWLGDIFTEKPDGEYVLYSDYSALAADYVEVKDLHLKCRIDIGNLQREVERLKFELECRQRSYDFMHGQAVERMSEILRLEDENEWLRKADRLICWNPKTEQWEIRHEAVR